MESEGENISSLWRRERKGDHSAAGRRRREMKQVPAKDRRAMRGGPIKDVQLNIKVTSEFKALLVSLSSAEKISMVECIERAVRARAEN